MVARLSHALFAVFDGFLRAVTDTRHAMGTVFAPRRFPLFQMDIVQRTFSHALSAADAGITCRKRICFYKEPIENRVDRAAHEAVIKVVSGC